MFVLISIRQNHFLATTMPKSALSKLTRSQTSKFAMSVHRESQRSHKSGLSSCNFCTRARREVQSRRIAFVAAV